MKNIVLRNAEKKDHPFLLQLYMDVRREEVAAWGWNKAQQNAFLKMQFSFQDQAYASEFPQAQYQIILIENNPAGRLIVNRSNKEIHLVDISLLETYRNQGIGSKLITDLLKESRKSKMPVRLQVMNTNPAFKLYERLGFKKIAESGLYIEMEFKP